jgi:hypothetical protein
MVNPSEPTCTYPKCQCAFLWCEGKHPPCPVTGRRDVIQAWFRAHATEIGCNGNARS